MDDVTLGDDVRRPVSTKLILMIRFVIKPEQKKLPISFYPCKEHSLSHTLLNLFTSISFTHLFEPNLHYTEVGKVPCWV